MSVVRPLLTSHPPAAFMNAFSRISMGLRLTAYGNARVAGSLAGARPTFLGYGALLPAIMYMAKFLIT